MEIVNIDSNINYKYNENTFIKIYEPNNEIINELFFKEVKFSMYLFGKKVSPKIKYILLKNDKKIIFFERIKGVTIDKINLKDMSYKKRINLFLKILKKVKILHNNGIIHNDLTLNNIMIDKEEIYIIDFSESKFFDEKINKKYVSFSEKFSPIEQYSKFDKSSFQSDFYNLTSIFYYILFQKYYIKTRKMIINLPLEMISLKKIIFFLKKGFYENKLKRFKDIDEMILKVVDLLEEL